MGNQARVVVVGGGPSGMTAALLLARAGHLVTLVEREAELGGLWACRLDGDGHYLSENSCKVYQSSYRTSPALFRAIGTRWEEHFVPRHDLSRDWLRPFLSDCSFADLARLGGSFARHVAGATKYRDVSVAAYLEAHSIGEDARSWMRATALGGITGTLRMTMWELFHRLESNALSIAGADDGVLYWNARPPNAPGGFLSIWRAALEAAGVRIATSTSVRRIVASAGDVRLETDRGAHDADAVFLGVPPALAALVEASPDDVALAFGRGKSELRTVLAESVYTHLGIAYTFATPLPAPLPLGGHNVRRGWHPILVEHSQYRAHLCPPASALVVASVSVDTDLRHPRLGTRASDHAHTEIAAILWDDERRVDPSLPEPLATTIHGLSSATQIVGHGPLGVRARGLPLFVATQLSGAAPYFTASLESAIQAGAAAAAAFDPSVERFPTGTAGRARPPALRAWGVEA